MLNIQIPDYASDVLSRLHHAGYEAWVVGGCVRDSLLGRTPGDWDITTSALPQQTRECFADLPVIETGIAHGTVLIVSRGEPVEVTTYRIDGSYSDCRHPDFVTFSKTLHEDLARRDFTVNALAYCPLQGLRDDFGGRKDLADRVIRCVGNARNRFEEDALRMLRALRFACVLDFSIEEKTADAIHLLCNSLRTIAAERIGNEWRKLLCGVGVSKILRCYGDVCAVFLPELTVLLKNQTQWETVMDRIDSAPQEYALRMAMLFRAIPQKTKEEQARLAKNALQRLRFDRKTTERIGTLVCTQLPQPLTRPQMRRMLGQFGEALLKEQLLLLQTEQQSDLSFVFDLLDDIVAQKDCVTLSQLAINGHDLPHAGKQTGALLSTALEAVMEDRIPNQKDAILHYLQSQLQ